jgi:hypothetical protein
VASGQPLGFRSDHGEDKSRSQRALCLDAGGRLPLDPALLHLQVDQQHDDRTDDRTDPA